MDLKTLQEKMAAAIIDHRMDILDGIEPGGKLSDAAEALRVYQGGYPARLTSALGENYEGVWSVLGDEEFFAVCEAFIRENRSRDFNLSNYDERFPGYLAGRKDLNRDFPFLPELAAFEWEFYRLFHLAGDVPKSWNPEELVGIDETSRLQLSSTLKLFSFSYRSFDIWRRRKENQAEAVDFTRPQWVAMYKLNGNPVQSVELEAWQLAVISSLQAGRSLGESLPGDHATDQAVSQLFALMMQNQWLSVIVP